MNRRGVGVGAAVTVVALVAGVGWYAVHHDAVPFLQPEQCTAEVGGHSVALDLEQARYAGLITAVAVERGLPARAASIALATAYQESKLHNLDGGDRDSAGLFQQRPSQGWGSLAQVRDPVHATNAFYDALARVDGYESLAITVAAQEVQRSGFPDAYAVHEADARALASALTGNSEAAFSCRLTGSTHGSTDAVRRDLLARFPDLPIGRVEAKAVDLTLPPGSQAGRTRGWAVAQYLVSQADRLAIRSVAFDGRVWTSGDGSGDGWRSSAGTGSDHVHVEIY